MLIAPAKLQKRTTAEKWLLVAGSGIIAGLAGLLWLLINGADVMDPLPKGILAAIFACMLAVVFLVTAGERRGTGAAVTA